jgi:periplasmic divalent cation tolerance protein
MKPARNVLVVLVTAPDLKTARKIVQAVLTKRLAACANIVPRIESHYWWQGKLESSGETLIVFKTTRQRLPRLEATVLAIHPYDTPEVIALRLDSGNDQYVRWISASVKL